MDTRGIERVCPGRVWAGMSTKGSDSSGDGRVNAVCKQGNAVVGVQLGSQ